MTRQHTRRRPTAFTLIELLVVILIISILVGLLMPMLVRAREKGKMTACASNLKNIGEGLVMYGNSNRDCLPWLWDGVVSWDAAITNYLGREMRVFACPSDRAGDTGNTNWWPRSYAANGILGGGASPRYPFMNKPVVRTYLGDVRNSSHADVILVGEKTGPGKGNRGIVGRQTHCALEKEPGEVHMDRRGGQYLFSSMAVRYNDAEHVRAPPNGEDFWTVEK